MTQDAVNVSQLHEFDEIIDVRSPAEFALDHIPGAVNCPVLDDDERARVGTMYVQDSPFSAKRIGAALVARNIANHLERAFSEKPRSWRPLIYCWRGGQRSASMTIVLRQTGWDARRLAGGYKAFRRRVVREIDEMVPHLSFRVVCGLTGTGKSALLRALVRTGGQVLDLEDAAAHRGSLLGALPNDPQPTQKMFDSRVWQALRNYDRTRPVYVEAESRKIGKLRVPPALIAAMRASPCILLNTAVADRVELLLREYAHFTGEPTSLAERIEGLRRLHGRTTIERWKSLIAAREWPEFVLDMLQNHYDPAYRKSTTANYPGLEDAVKVTAVDTSDNGFSILAREILAEESGRPITLPQRADLTA